MHIHNHKTAYHQGGVRFAMSCHASRLSCATSDHIDCLPQAEEYLATLDPVIQRLNNDIPQAGYDRRSLSQLVVQLQQFMEVALGIKVRHGMQY